MSVQVARHPTPPARDAELEIPLGPTNDRNRQAAALLRQWMAQDDGYDDEIWPFVEEEMKNIRMRCRE